MKELPVILTFSSYALNFTVFYTDIGFHSFLAEKLYIPPVMKPKSEMAYPLPRPGCTDAKPDVPNCLPETQTQSCG